MLVDLCESRLNIHLECAQLRNMDYIGKSDPFAVLFIDQTGSTRSENTEQDPIPPSNSLLRTSSHYRPRSDSWTRVGQTETIKNALNVTWTESFEIPYFFERPQRLAVDVFDRDNFRQPNGTLNQQSYRLHDYLGSAEVSVSAIVRAPNQKLVVPLSIPSRPNQRCGFLTIIAEDISELKQRIHYNIKLHGLSRWKTIRYSSNPFLTISRQSAGRGNNPNPNQNWINVMTTKVPAVVSETTEGQVYHFPPISYNYEKFCRRNDHLKLHFKLTFLHNGNQEVVASAIATLAEIHENNGQLQLKRPCRRRKMKVPWTRSPLINTNTNVPRLGSDAGCYLQFTDRNITEDVTFLDYIMGGCEISLMIAIDFTASNGPPESPGTLHFADRINPNEYETAIRYVGDILAAYDSDQWFPAYGFGAKLPPYFTEVAHQFPLNTTTGDAYCQNIDGVLNQYRTTLHSVRLSGPSHLSEIIRVAADDHADSEVSQINQRYTILLILTDGIIEDIDRTLLEIERASAKPLSIVIIGVGDQNFDDMKLLDGDDRGQERDIVQFVKFREYRNAPEVLRAEVLQEIPRQLEQYMLQRGIKPNPLAE